MLRVALPCALVTALLLAGCGAQPAVSAAPAARAASAPESAKARRASFRFFSYQGLSAEERRILDASQLVITDGENTTMLGGQPLYEHLAAQAPKLLANYLNQTAVMATVRFADGRTALSYVQKLEGLKINHVYAVVEPGLKEAISAIAAPKSRSDAAYVGPEDSSLMHGKYDTSYRENRPYTSQQFAFSAVDGFTRVDIDLDEECPLAGSKLALAQHLIRAIKHELLRKLPGEQYGENSEPDYFFHALRTAPTSPDGKANKVGRGLQPNYELERP